MENKHYTRKVGFWEVLPPDTFWFEEINEKTNKGETHIVVRLEDDQRMSRHEITQDIIQGLGIETPMVSFREHKWAVLFWMVVLLTLVIFIGYWIVRFFQWLF